MDSNGAQPDQAAIADSLAKDSIEQADSSFWRREIAARVKDYRAKRKPRLPRYPSLRLQFEAAEAEGESQTKEVAVRATTRRSVALETAEAIPAAVPEPSPERGSAPASPPQSAQTESAKIIEFPRLYPEPAPLRFDELADPVIDQPRIVEAPEFVPPPPALGGIILEPDEQEAERRLGLEIPLHVASIPRRILAAVIDGVLVLIACAVFGGIFFWLTAHVPPRPQILGMSVAIPAAFGAVYQFLLLTYTGSTPGLRLARLRLSRFDGSPVNRRLRRWRVAASILSGIALGLGFAWCLVDEDALCWHDRITRTYLVP